MARKRTPSAKAIAANDVAVAVAGAPMPSPTKTPKARPRPPSAPSLPLPALNVQDSRPEPALIQSEYEEVPSAAAFQPLSAATINSSPCKTVPSRPHPSPLRMSSPRTSPSILKKRGSFDGRIQLLESMHQRKLPILESVAPPVIKPEMVAEAKLVQAARALKRYASSESEDESDEAAWETQQPYKRQRTSREENRRASLPQPARADDDWRERAREEDVGEKETHRVSKVRDVLLAMAEQAAESHEPRQEVQEEQSALSLLASASDSRPGSAEPDGDEGRSQDTIPQAQSEPAAEEAQAAKSASDIDNNIVSFLTALSGAV